MLPLCLGQATRLVEYLVEATKAYVAEIRLGIETNTYDAEGEVIARNDPSGVDLADVQTELGRFRGEFEQQPPAFSAIKQSGVPLYKMARRGELVAAAARPVRVERLDITGFESPLLRLEIDCGKGFYVRSLAHDLGEALGVGGMLSGLVRTRVGHFRLEDAVAFDVLRQELESEAWQARLLAPDEVLVDWQAAIVSAANGKRLGNGLEASFSSPAHLGVDRCRAYMEDGSFLAVLRRVSTASWRPEKVFRALGALPPDPR